LIGFLKLHIIIKVDPRVSPARPGAWTTLLTGDNQRDIKINIQKKEKKF
jgi:hypothetical protein